jgi:CheY-like chemotaxis protein
MERGGRFSISTARERLDSEFAERYPGIEIRPGVYTRITVQDTGVGMDEVTLGRVFEPFFTTKPVGQGSGLGLATVYGIVKQSNGYVWAESSPTAGSSFHVYLPQTAGEIERPSAGPPALDLQRGHATILVVDDEEMIRALARRALELFGYDVVEAEDGVAALRAVQQDEDRRIAVVVADVVMPRMDGRELSERIRASHPDLSVLFMSGHTGDELARRRLLDPTVPFLQKPFHPDELVSQVQKLLDPVARAAR